MEAFQPTGSFKIRGIGHACQMAAEKGATHFISSSGGNAGLAVAFCGRKLKLPVIVFLPRNAPDLMRKKIESEGAQVIVHGDVWDEANLAALERSKESGSAYIPPFDLPDIWQGNSSIIEEIDLEISRPDAVVLSVGGGGLLGGILIGMEKFGWAKTKVFTAETTGAASFAQSVAAGNIVSLHKIDTVAHSLGAKTVSRWVFEYSQNFDITPLVVSDNEAVSACIKFADEYRVLVEPACGAALACGYNDKIRLSADSNLVIVVCGGAAVTTLMLQTWSERALSINK